MGSYSQNSKVRTLTNVEELNTVNFGHRFPRQGLKLLHWLVEDVVGFDNKGRMLAQCNPHDGKFGFHPFHNRENILPPLQGQSEYFEVGNLHSSGAWELPFNEAQRGSKGSNTDRIIVRLDTDQVISQVYITEHAPYFSRFSAKDTYCLSKGLIRAIKGMSLEEFLWRAGYIEHPEVDSNDLISLHQEETATPKKNEVTVVDVPDYPRPSYKKDNVCSCIIL